MSLTDILAAEEIRRRLAQLDNIETMLLNLGEDMARQTDELTALRTQLTDASADILAKLDQLETAAGDLTPEAQQIVDDLRTSVQALDTRVGDADGSDNPPADGGDGTDGTTQP